MRTLYRAASVLVLSFASVVGPVSAAATPVTVAQSIAAQPTLTGRVTDSRGNTLAGASVTAQGAGTTATTKTGGDGSFSLSLLPGLYTITVDHGGFQSAQNDVAVAAGSKQNLGITLQELNLQSLRVIGRSSTSYSRAPFNVSEAAVNVLPNAEITLRQNNTLADIVSTLPGVVSSKTFSATPNTNFIVRGGALQTRVTIDGHPVSSGISGQWNSNYAVSTIFQNVEAVKGAGLNGAIAGESAVGTVNLRTRDFTDKNSFGASIGSDGWGSGVYNAFADINFLPNNRASLIVQKAFSGFNGPWNNYFGDRAGRISSITPGVGQIPNIVGLDQWQGDYSNRYSLQGELAKLRYRFNDSTSLTFEYLGLQGQYMPQGGSYGTFDGNMTLQACQNGSTFSPTLAGCGASSLYTAPYTFNNIGATVPAYTWFPQSFIQNNEPTFAAELRTTFKDDTILFRPYTHLINRYISGVNENKYPGNNGGWYPVTNVANCQVKFLGPGATGGAATGAQGPCFPVTMSPNSPAYIGSDTTGHGFATTANAPSCSPTPPYTCFTTPTGIENDGLFNYGTPFSQPELDRLNGYTFSYIHPVGPNVFNFSYDYRKDFSQSASSDTSGAGPGCSYVIGSVAGTRPGNSAILPGVTNVYDNNGVPYQPNCSTAQFGASTTAATPYAGFNLLPRSPIGVPPTVSQYQDIALTGTWQLTDNLRLALGNYFEIYRLNAQIEDPNVLAAYAARGNSSAAPVSLVPRGETYSHYDPHFGVEYRVNPNLSVRASAGSSITQPYPSLVSGFGSISLPNAASHNYSVNIPNFNLKPETTVSYDLGFDQRLADGGVLSIDAYHLTVHDVFLSNTTTIAPVAGVLPFADTLYLQSQQINGPLQRSFGLEMQLSKIPTLGFGYYVSATAQRAYYEQLPLSIYSANTSPGSGNFNVNWAQLFGYPFFKAYGQVLYNGPRNSTVELGADLEGQNNFTFGPPYVIYDAAVGIPLHPKVRLLLSAQNLTNLSTGTALGRNLQSQGFIQPQLYLNPATGQLLPTGASSSMQALPPRTIRLLLSFTQ